MLLNRHTARCQDWISDVNAATAFVSPESPRTNQVRNGSRRKDALVAENIRRGPPDTGR